MKTESHSKSFRGSNKPKATRKASSDSDSRSGSEEQKQSSRANASGAEIEVKVVGLPFAATEDEINSEFAGYGEIKSVKLLKRFDGSSKGVCFLKFAEESAANKALEKNKTDFGGRTIYVSKAGENDERFEKPAFERSENREPSNTIFVGNLSFQTTEDELRDLFSGSGDINEVRLGKDQEGNVFYFKKVQGILSH